jgi:hypothetical protein
MTWNVLNLENVLYDLLWNHKSKRKSSRVYFFDLYIVESTFLFCARAIFNIELLKDSENIFSSQYTRQTLEHKKQGLK